MPFLPLKKTLMLAEKYGSALLDGSITAADLKALTNSFINFGGWRDPNLAYSNEHYTKTEAIKDFIEYIDPFISNEQLHQLNKRLLVIEMSNIGQVLRNETLPRRFLIHEAKRNNALELFNKSEVPVAMIDHFQQQVIPFLTKLNPGNMDSKNSQNTVVSFYYNNLIAYLERPIILDNSLQKSTLSSYSSIKEIPKVNWLELYNKLTAPVNFPEKPSDDYDLASAQASLKRQINRDKSSKDNGISVPRTPTKGSKLSQIDSEGLLSSFYECIMKELNNPFNNLDLNMKINTLETLYSHLIAVSDLLSEQDKSKVALYLSQDQYRKENDKTVIELLENIETLLRLAPKIKGQLNLSLVYSPDTPSKVTLFNSLTHIMFNKFFIYSESGKPFLVNDKIDEQNNQVGAIAGAFDCKIQDVTINMDETPDGDLLQKKNLDKATTDADLQEWIHLNTHQYGPVAICWQNIAQQFQKLGVEFLMDQDEDSRLYNGLYHFYSRANDPNSIYFHVNIPFKTAKLRRDDKCNIISCERKDLPANIKLPVAVFEVIIKVTKKDNRITAELEIDTFDCFHPDLVPAFNVIDRFIKARMFYDQLRKDIKFTLNNFVTDASSTPTPISQMTLFSLGSAILGAAPEGEEIIKNLNLKLKEEELQIQQNPTELNYEEKSRELLDYFIDQKYKFLAKPVTPSGIRLHAVLIDLYDNWSKQFKDYRTIKESKRTTLKFSSGSKAPLFPPVRSGSAAPPLTPRGSDSLVPPPTPPPGSPSFN